MRVIGGEFRSRLLKSLPAMDVRPTPDRLRETLFNILAPAIPGSVFLDAYAGTGAVGIEALSRGAERAIFIEKSREAAIVIEENLKSLGLQARARVHRGVARTKIVLDEPGIAFLDPPYPESAEYGVALALLGAMQHPMVVVAQHSFRLVLEDAYGALKRTREVRQGENALTFFQSEDPQLHGGAEAAAEDSGGAGLAGGDLEVP